MKFATALVAATIALGVALPAAAQKTYSIGTNPQGSLAYGSGTAVAKLMNEKGNLLARVRAGGGSSTIVPQMDRGQIDFGFNNALEVRQSFEGIGIFQGKPQKNMRIVTQVYPLLLAFAVPADSPIKTLADAKTMRIPCRFTAQIILAEVQDAMLASGGLTTNDFKCVPVANYIKGQHLLPEGRADIAMAGPGSGASKEDHAKLKSRGGLRFISIDASTAGVARMQKVFPESFPYPVKGSKDPSFHGDTTVFAYPYFLTAGAHVADDVIEKVVKLMAANKADLAASFGAFNRFDSKKMAPASKVPYHPGAVKAYKELGIWNR